MAGGHGPARLAGGDEMTCPPSLFDVYADAAPPRRGFDIEVRPRFRIASGVTYKAAERILVGYRGRNPKAVVAGAGE